MAFTNGMNGVSEYAQFYNSDNHDRVYDADSMAEWLTPFFADGIFNGQMQVTANDDMTVSVAPGFGYIDGKVKHFPTSTKLNIDLAHAQYQRIDLIVLRRDDTLRDFFIDVLKGTPAQNPVAPELTRNNTIWELQLAKITLPIGATKITQANITDTRMNKPECGWVAATVDEIDFNQIKAQFDTWYAETTSAIENTYETWRQAFEQNADEWFDGETSAFMDWFQRMKDQLSTDAAGNLQLQIDDLTYKINTDIQTTISTIENRIEEVEEELSGKIDMYGSTSWALASDDTIDDLLTRSDNGEIDLRNNFGWSVGDERVITLNGQYMASTATLVIMDYDKYTLEDGSSKSKFIVGFKEGIRKAGINSSSSNSGGWDACWGRSNVMPAIESALPEYIKKHMKTFIVRSATSSTGSTLSTSYDKLALFSEREITGSTSVGNTSDGNYYSQIEYYRVAANRVKKKYDDIANNCSYWTRTVARANNTHFCNVDTNGAISTSSANTNSNYYSPFLCF